MRQLFSRLRQCFAKIPDWLLSPLSPPRSQVQITSFLYKILFFAALCGAIQQFISLYRTGQLGLGGFPALVLAVCMLLQLGLVYHDIHLLDEGGREVDAVYGSWINRRLEVALRGLTLVFLLFGVGKVAHVFVPLVDLIQRPLWLKPELLHILNREVARELSSSPFVLGSVGVFFSLTAWNAFAAVFRIVDFRGISPRKRPRHFLTFVRTTAFALLSLLCLFYWGATAYGVETAKQSAPFIVFIYFILIAVAALLRWTRSVAWIGRWLVRAFGDPALGQLQKRLSGVEQMEWIGVIKAVYEKMQEEAQGSTGELVYRGHGLVIRTSRGVYAPGFFTDSEWFAKVLPSHVGTRSLLEVGCGSGLISLCCAREGATVRATDVCEQAVIDTRRNASANGLNIRVSQSDVYSGLDPDERFDVIFWAHPFNNLRLPKPEEIYLTGFDPNYQNLGLFVSGAELFLAPGGNLFLGTGSTADLEEISAIARLEGFQIDIVERVDMKLARGRLEEITYLLVRLSP